MISTAIHMNHSGAERGIPAPTGSKVSFPAVTVIRRTARQIADYQILSCK